MKRFIFGAAVLLVAVPLGAQSPTVKPEIRPFAGANIPAGAQRNLFQDAGMIGAQVALELKPTLHLLGTFGWVASQSSYAVSNDNVNLFMYDIGIEVSFVEAMGGKWELKPFIGVGAGGRTYAFSSATLKDQTCTAAYAAIGTEFQLAPWALRFEGRGNAFCYNSPISGVKSATRNDVGLSLGLAYHFR
jgi:hypothetical protein